MSRKRRLAEIVIPDHKLHRDDDGKPYTYRAALVVKGRTVGHIERCPRNKYFMRVTVLNQAVRIGPTIGGNEPVIMLD